VRTREVTHGNLPHLKRLAKPDTGRYFGQGAPLGGSNPAGIPSTIGSKIWKKIQNFISLERGMGYDAASTLDLNVSISTVERSAFRRLHVGMWLALNTLPQGNP